MKKFEYKVLKFPLTKAGMDNPKYDPDTLEATLNQLGKDGWELIQNLPRTAVAVEYHLCFIFKRER